MKQPGRVAPYVITFVLGTTLAGGVSAVAAASGASVKACENAHHLVVAAKTKSCPPGSHAVSIAQRGPKGLRGKVGTNGYSVSYIGKDLSDAISDVSSSYVAVNQVKNVPAGFYVATYQVNVTGHTGSLDSVQCHFAPGSNPNMFLGTDSDLELPLGETIGLQGSMVLTQSAAGEIDLVCMSQGGNATMENSDVTLLHVNAAVQSS